MKGLFYEDIEVGMEIPPLVKNPTTAQLVRWAGASGDFYELHYDKDFAQRAGMPGVLVHGQLKWQFLIQMITDWIGVYGTIMKIDCRYTGMDFPGDTLTCNGRVVKKFFEKNLHCFECELFLENQRGEKTVSANAVVSVPLKEQDA